MEAWIFTHNDVTLEHWMADFESTFDAWEEGGVRGIVVGRMQFRQDGETRIPAWRPDPKVYESFGVEPPAPAPRDPEKEKRLQAMLDNAAARGWHIMIFNGYQGLAGTQDIMNAFPQAHGVIIDGPGENHYELMFHHGGEVFDTRKHIRKLFEGIGADMDRIERGIHHLQERLHNLTPDLVRYHASGGMLSGMILFDINEDVTYWLRMRQEKSRRSWVEARRNVDRMNRKVELGGIPRTATFSPLTGQDYQQMAAYFDYIFPKHYYWHRGFDGMYGTVSRWVQRILQWNPSLTDQDAFAVIRSLLGLELPDITSLADMDLGFPEEFFSRVVYEETRRALDAINDVDKVICWVSTGRCPHHGDPMPALDLHRILTASQDAGLKRFLFHPEPELGAPEWRVISGMCGRRWHEDPEGKYWPRDTERPESSSRKGYFRPRLRPVD